MIIWRGWGIIAPLILILVMVILIPLSDFIGINEDIAIGISLLISGLLIYLVGKQMNQGENRTLQDSQTREEVIFSTKNQHTLFFIPIQYWGIILCVISFFFTFSVLLTLF